MHHNHTILDSVNHTSLSLHRVQSMLDLEVLRNSKLSFVDYVESLVSTVSKTFGYIKRTSADFQNTNITWHLYCALIVPKLFYASVTQSPDTTYFIKELKCIQHEFIRYIKLKMNQSMQFDCYEYQQYYAQIRLSTLYLLHAYHDGILA